MLEFNDFQKRRGVRRSDQLIDPIAYPLNVFEFPKNSLYHHQTDDPNEVGPSDQEPMFNRVTKAILLDHVTQVGDFKGNPRRISMQLEPMIRKHRVRNKRYRPIRDVESADRDNLSLMVYCYSLIPQSYRYFRSIYADYYKWWNCTAAVWKNAAKLAEETDRHQFIKIQVPKILPSIADLNIGEEASEPTQKILKLFRDDESRMLLEIWKWLGDHREGSMLAFVPVKHLHKINLIVEEAGKWTFVNLGLLNSWRELPKAEKEAALKENKDFKDKGKFTHSVLQKYFLKFMMVMFEQRTVGIDANAKVEDEVKEEIPEVVVVSPTGVQTDGKKVELAQAVQDVEPDDDHQHTEELEAKLNADMEELERISQRAQAQLDTEEEASEALPVADLVEAAPTETMLEDSVRDVCDALAESGMLSAAEYKRHLKLSETYRTMKAPDGKRLMADYIKIPFKELEIKESKAIPPIDTVIDKTMLKSSLIDFDKRYITEVLDRDVAACVLNIQKAGVSVTDYDVETVDHVMGSFKNYSIRVVPVNGAPCTLKFRLPVVDEDGFYVSNGVKYKLRKQVGELPIRKIDTNCVALTSYYGKVFVTRNEKRVNDYGQWLRNAITLKAFDEADPSVTEMHPGNVFDNLLPAPRMFTMMAQGFRRFQVTPTVQSRATGRGVYQFIFDNKERLAGTVEAIRTQFEKDGCLVVGFIRLEDGTIKNHLVMDENSAIHFTYGDNMVPLGTMESLLELDVLKAPKDFAELKVSGKYIPIGLILAHEMGLGNLIKALKIQARRVPVGTRVQLEATEWSLVFDDETLVFSREDELATLILAGFGDYRDIIRTYSVYEFDRKNVYLNILESKQLGIRYLREIELLYQMFIDPITFEILEEMKEPQTFRGLLIRSCELLLTDHHPDLMDPAFTRKKGYERFAGTVYSELVKSVRAHRGRIERSRAPIELHPHAVWMTISQDPSKILVNEINPIQNLKETESVTFGGNGGRSSRSMTKPTRAYHKNDMGTISESTVDSSDVGINNYTSADPAFTSLRGLSKRYDFKEKNPTSLFSTSALLAPGSDHDD